MNSETVKDSPVPRVMIVDDNVDAAKTTGVWLGLTGHEVEVVVDSKMCLGRLESFCPHVLLLDLAMPGLSGFEIAKRLRAQPRFAKLAIIAVSGFADVKHVQQSADFGCDQHLAKPVDLHFLKRVIASEFQKSLSALRAPET
jgi:two-component system, chemotaxis family, CheB/CheR fusion protein